MYIKNIYGAFSGHMHSGYMAFEHENWPEERSEHKIRIYTFYRYLYIIILPFMYVYKNKCECEEYTKKK